MSGKILFHGMYRKNLDSGNRLVIPSSFLKSLGDDQALVGYVHNNEKCIRFYSASTFEEMVEAVVKNYDENTRARVQRSFYMNSKYFEPDIRNRVALPQKFLDATGIHGSVAVIGVGTRFEVWDEDIYEDMISVVDASDLKVLF